MGDESTQQTTKANVSEQPILTKRRCGRLRKEDAQMREQELTVEARAKRDKRRQDNLKAAARYRHKKDIALKELSEQIEGKDRQLQNAEQKILELQTKVQELEFQIALAKRFIEHQKCNLDKAGLEERVKYAPATAIEMDGKEPQAAATKRESYDEIKARTSIEMRSSTPVISASRPSLELLHTSNLDQPLLREPGIQRVVQFPKTAPEKTNGKEQNVARLPISLNRVRIPRTEAQQRLTEMQRQPTPPVIQGIPKYEGMPYGHNLVYVAGPSDRGVERGIFSSSRQLKLPIIKPLTTDEDPLAFLRTNRKRPGRSPPQNFIPSHVSSGRLVNANGQPVVEVLSKDPNVASNILNASTLQYSSNRGYAILGARQATE